MCDTMVVGDRQKPVNAIDMHNRPEKNSLLSYSSYILRLESFDESKYGTWNLKLLSYSLMTDEPNIKSG